MANSTCPRLCRTLSNHKYPEMMSSINSSPLCSTRSTFGQSRRHPGGWRAQAFSPHDVATQLTVEKAQLDPSNQSTMWRNDLSLDDFWSFRLEKWGKIYPDGATNPSTGRYLAPVDCHFRCSWSEICHKSGECPLFFHLALCHKPAQGLVILPRLIHWSDSRCDAHFETGQLFCS